MQTRVKNGRDSGSRAVADRSSAGKQAGGSAATFADNRPEALQLEMLQMLAETLRPIDFSSDQLAMDAIAEVQPGGHHFGTAHTLERYQTAFYETMLSTRQNFETWQEAGSKDAATRANEIWKALLAEYQRPAMDEGLNEALESYVERRKREISARST